MAGRGARRQVRLALDAVEAAPDPLAALAAARHLREMTEAMEIAIVAEVRRHGGTWTQIGTVYGTTKQGAQQRFRDAVAGVSNRGRATADELDGPPERGGAA